MPVFKEGDYAAVLNESIYGYVLKSGSKKTVIRDMDGFEREYPNEKLVHAKPVENYKLGDDLDHKEILKKLNPAQKKQKVISVSKPPFEIDLHYDSLVEERSAKENYQILQKQLSACRSFVQKAIRTKMKYIVLIHGKGEGVLKSEIHLYLTRLNSEQGVRLTFNDAPYSEYGMGGATEVTFY